MQVGQMQGSDYSVLLVLLNHRISLDRRKTFGFYLLHVPISL